ncbi:MAG TPA: biotin/lipoyl-containing protein, partial [Gemmatimonadaceae bacterium]|nr:biotin/lipoyl-containing protein [Gemmatimonadaceae bacterium]
MARVDIIMPQMGESIAEGTLSKWLKKVGDEVKRDEPIFEISTDKVDAEIPAPAAGVLAEIIVKEGETVAIQTVVARLETEKGAAIGKSAPTPATGAVAGSEPTTGAKPSSPPAPQREGTPAPAQPRQPTPAPAIAASHTGNGNSFEDRVRTKSSPLVRKIAAEHGVNISSLQGSGIAGRVTKRDIIGFIESGAPMPAAAPGARAGG